MSPGWLAFCAMTLFSIWQAHKWTQAEKRITKQDRDIISLTKRLAAARDAGKHAFMAEFEKKVNLHRVLRLTMQRISFLVSCIQCREDLNDKDYEGLTALLDDCKEALEV